MKKYNVKPTKGVWVEDPKNKDTEYLIRPIQILSMTKLPTEQSDFDPKDIWEMFNFALMDWKGVVDEDEKKIKCNEESKKMVYEYDQETVAFVLERSNELRQEVISNESAKN